MHMSDKHLMPLCIWTVLFAAGCIADETELSADIAANHCVFQFESEQMSCFDSFTDAMVFATQGRINDAPADAAAAAADENLEARINTLAKGTSESTATVAEVVITIFYWNKNFGGRSAIYTRSYGCDGNLSTPDFETPEFPRGHNNEYSSFQTFANCAVQLYQFPGFGGVMTPISYTMAYVGSAINNRVSSARWF